MHLPFHPVGDRRKLPIVSPKSKKLYPQNSPTNFFLGLIGPDHCKYAHPWTRYMSWCLIVNHSFHCTDLLAILVMPTFSETTIAFVFFCLYLEFLFCSSWLVKSYSIIFIPNVTSFWKGVLSLYSPP